jgi:hypothetical protein
MSGVVSVVALVYGLQSEKVGRRACGGGRPLPLPIHCWGVVVTVVDGVFSHVHSLGYDVMLSHCPRQLQITVGETSLWVVPSD